MMDERLVPKLRFPEFTGDWEQRKLNDFLKVSKAKNKEEVFGKEDVLSVSGDFGIVNQIEFQGRSFAGVSVAPYGIVDTGDIVYTKSPLKANPYGIIKTNKGKPGIVSTLYAVYKPLDNVYSEFVQVYFEQDLRMNNYMHPLVNKGAKNDMKVSDENAIKGEVCFPCRDEQIKISEFFAKLDNTIALHQRKLELLEKQKKGVMQKIFSQEIRFKAGDGSDYPEWKHHSLIEIFDTRNGYTPSKVNPAFWENGTIPWYRMEDIRENGGVLYDAIQHISETAKKGAGWFPAETVIFATSATVGEHAILMTEALSNQRFTAIIPKKQYKDELHPMFVYYIGFDIDRYCLEHQSLGTMPAVDMNSFKRYRFPMPCREEQQKIADFLSEIDKAIDLAKQELEKWKLLKKGLLQQMFV